ncbi:hypothetical protein HK096_001986, partial [Nowakowskiella sp. JEL0078]
FVFDLPNAESINHIVVFLTGSIPFPDGYGATVHFYWPTQDNVNSLQWILLGMLSNAKPSAIFKLGGKKTYSSSSTAAAFQNIDSDMIEESFSHVTAQLGISIELLDVVSSQISMLTPVGAVEKTITKTTNEQAEFAKSMLENFANYAMSFTQKIPQTFGSNETYIPSKVGYVEIFFKL